MDETYSISYYDIFKNKKIGKGSYSNVYLGKCKNNKIIDKYNLCTDKVAIKKLPLNNQSYKVTKMIKEEILIMRKIMENPNPSIIKCIDIIDDIDYVYIVMEYCDGGELINIMGSSMEEQETLFYFTQIYNGLIYLNTNKIIHRDIKPKNLLLKSNNTEIKIADFGLAKIHTSLNRIDTICGSPLYMAPEVLSEKSYNHTVDIWSLGLILYEFIFGFNPFADCTDMDDLKEAVFHKNINYPKKNISNLCMDLLKKLLEKDGDKRINIYDIKNHPWMKGELKNINQDINNFNKTTKPINIIKKNDNLIFSFDD
jgi:serine/threonine protein kinase